MPDQTLVSVGGDKVVVSYLKNGALSSTELAVGVSTASQSGKKEVDYMYGIDYMLCYYPEQ
jgi:hypothetical protein